ncbi:RNA helicase [Pycnococcus provasolii]
MKAQRERLPAYEARQSLIDACERPCVVVSGETGCGKSTQVPQYILESMIEDGDGGAAFIVVAQPRRVAATSLAERVASERSERCGDVVGYSVRLDTKRSRRTRLLFCTTGVLLQMLIRDPKLVGVTHVVVDEVHERSVEGDLLLLMLRRALVRDMERIAKGVSAGGVRGNRPLKAVMMSATANASLFCEYFERAGMESATMHIPGFTHPVREHFLEDVFEMTGYRVGKGSKYAKRGQKAAAAKAALAEAAEREKLAERARHRERLEAEAASARLEAMSLQADSWEELADGSGIGGDDDDDSATPMLPVAPASAKPTLEVPTPEEEELLWNAPATAASDRAAEAGEEAEAKRLARDELARARQHFEELGEATRRSTEQVDEEILNPDILVEAVRLVLLRHGDGGLIPPPSAKRAPAAADAAPAILVFLSGAAPIFKCMRRLDSASQPGMRLCEDEVGHRLLVLPLHGSLPPREQRKVFARPPKNSVKVILATNVAETSLTIDDVQYVIDFGKVNESRHDAARGLSVLAETWCSRAAAKQRRGRAGRTRPGACVRLYSRFTFWGDMPHQQAPEIVRTPLEPLILRIKAILGARVPVREVISEALTAPPQESVDAAVDALRSMGALSDETSPSAPVLEVLTPLGRHLSLLPVDPRVGKLLVFGSILSCLDEVLTIAACLGEKSMFPPPAHDASEEDRKERKLAIRSLLLPTVRDGEDADEVDPSGALSAKAATAVASDHMLDAYAFDAWRRARSRNGERGARAFADAHFADGNLMSNIAASRIEFAEALLERGFCDADFVERQRRALDDTSALAALGAPAPHRVVKAALLAAYYPHVLRVQHPKATYVETSGGTVRTDGDASQVKFFSSDGSRVFLHPSSLAFDISKYACPWLVVTDKAETQPLQQAAASKAKQNAFAGRPRVVARAVSMASPYALLLFGGELEVVHEKSLVRVGKWVEYGAPARVGVLVRRLRGSLDRALLRKVEDPQFDVGATAAARACLKLVVGDGKV